MAFLSKPLSDEQKAFAHKRICELAVLGVTTQNIQGLADTRLMSECLGGDAGKVAAMLAMASSMGGLIEFLLNPIIGKLSDDWGRKWVYYLGPAISGVGMSCVVLQTGGNNLPVLVLHKALSWSLISQSCSFIAPITLSDMYTGQELGIRTVSFFGSVGMSLLIFPTIATFVARRGSRTALFKVRLVCALLQLVYVHWFVPETLLRERHVSFKASDVNPFSFLKLFRKSHALRVLVAALFFHCTAEGKNMVPLRSIWLDGPPLHWSYEKRALSETVFGAAAMVVGKYIAPKLIREMGTRSFTSSTNISNALSFAITGMPFPSYDSMYWLGTVLHIPGINATSAAAIKGVTTDHAVANGFARGEYGGMYSSVRTFSMIIAPMIFGWAYKCGLGSTSKASLGLPWFLAALLGGVMPELLHRSLSNEELCVPKPQVKEQLLIGVAPGSSSLDFTKTGSTSQNSSRSCSFFPSRKFSWRLALQVSSNAKSD